MHVISRTRLAAFWSMHPDAERPLRTWHRLVATGNWAHFMELKRAFPSVDQVGRLTVFDIGGNKYRLVAYLDYQTGKVFVRKVLTHTAYTKGGWKDDPWF